MSPNTLPDISVCLINHRAKDYTLACLRSIFAHTHRASLEVIVVENASLDCSAQAIQREFPQVYLLQNAVPQTFTVNCNLAIRYGTGRYILVLNNDTVIEEGALDLLLQFMDHHPRCGAASAKLFSPDGLAQPVLVRTLSLKRYLYEILVVQNLTVVSTAYRQRISQKRDLQGITQVENLCGACMLVRRSVIEQVGIFDEQYNFYGEDIDWSYRIGRAGWQMYIVPEARILHYGDASLGQIRARAKIEEYKSVCWYFKKHHLDSVAAHLILKVAWLLTASLRLAGYTVLAIGNRPNAKHHAACYVQILRWHIRPERL